MREEEGNPSEFLSFDTNSNNTNSILFREEMFVSLFCFFFSSSA